MLFATANKLEGICQRTTKILYTLIKLLQSAIYNTIYQFYDCIYFLLNAFLPVIASKSVAIKDCYIIESDYYVLPFKHIFTFIYVDVSALAVITYFSFSVSALPWTLSQIPMWQLKKYHHLNIKRIARGHCGKLKYLHDLNMKM